MSSGREGQRKQGRGGCTKLENGGVDKIGGLHKTEELGPLCQLCNIVASLVEEEQNTNVNGGYIRVGC